LAREALDDGQPIRGEWLAALGEVVPSRVRQLIASAELPSDKEGRVKNKAAREWLFARRIRGVTNEKTPPTPKG
jgi:hypothetical protein